MSRAIVGILLGVGLSLPGAGVHAQRAVAAENCQPGETLALHDGFQDLGDILGNETVGAPIDCEHPNPLGGPGDTMQTTSGGVFDYYKSGNLVVFTDSELNHWATAHDGIVTWSGDKPFPPEAGSKLHTWDSLTPGQAP